MTKTKTKTIEDGVVAIERMINEPWPQNKHQCMDGSSLGRIVMFLGEDGFDIDSTDEDGRSVMFGPEMVVEKNIFYWIGSQFLSNVLKAGVEQNRFHLRPMSIMAAMIDGGLMPQYEIAKSLRSYKEPRWLPVALWLGPHDDWTEARHTGAEWTPR